MKVLSSQNQLNILCVQSNLIFQCKILEAGFGHQNKHRWIFLRCVLYTIAYIKEVLANKIKIYKTIIGSNMSRDFGVYLNTKNLPIPSAWADAILQQGFPCELDDDINFLTFSGFLPCPVNGEMRGFEYYAYELDEDMLSEFSSFQINYGVTFIAGNRKFENIAALAASSCLAALTGGYLIDFSSGLMLKSDLAINWAKSQIEMEAGKKDGH